MSIIVLFFLLVTSSVFRTTRAQSPPAPLVTHVVSNGAAAPRATFPMLLIIFVFALFITAFCSIYIRYCSYQQPHALPQSAPRGCGIDPRVLATCPVMSYSAARMKTPQNAAFQCAVCLAEFDDADSLRLLPKCGHVFHPACIDTWLAAHVTCPVCRGEVSVEIEEETRARHMLNESSARGFGFGVLLRSHSTGHSLERFTLRLPKEVTKNILENGERGSVITRMKRSASYDVVLRSVEGGEGSSNSNSKGKSNYNDNNQWVLSMTPSFVSRGSDSSNVGTACPGILRFWGASVVREEKECQGRTVFRCAV